MRSGERTGVRARRHKQRKSFRGNTGDDLRSMRSASDLISRMRQRIRDRERLRERGSGGVKDGGGALSLRSLGVGARVSQTFKKVAVITAKLNAANKARKGLIAKAKSGVPAHAQQPRRQSSAASAALPSTPAISGSI